MAKEQPQEVDLMFLLDKVKDFYHGLLASFYRAMQFIKKYWIILLVLLVGGYFLGMLWKDAVGKKRSAVILVQNNFGSSNYVYNAIELLNIKSQQQDKSFLKQNGFGSEEPEIVELVVEPVLSLRDLLEQSEPNDRNIDFYLSELSVEDDVMESEIFYPQYKYHKITLTTQSNNPDIIEKVLNYLNSTEQFNAIKETIVAETQLRIERNNFSITKIDEFFEDYSEQEQFNANPGLQVYFNQENLNIPMLIEKKAELMDENETLKTELTKFDHVVAVMNKPYLYGVSSLTDKKTVLVPFFLLFFFIGFFVVRNWYTKGKLYATKDEAQA